MKLRTIIILFLLVALLSLSVYFIIKANSEVSQIGESVPAGESSSVITSERRDKPTPNGGDYSVIFYFDDDGNSVDKTVATKAIIKEYKSDGTVINEIFADISKSE